MTTKTITEAQLAAALKVAARQKDHEEGRRKGYSSNYFDPEAAAIFAALPDDEETTK